MYIYIFFVVAAALAVPSYGASVLGFYLLKRTYDNRTIDSILALADVSAQGGLTMEMPRVNKAAVNKLFDRCCIEGTDDGFSLKGISMRWGVFVHPTINGGKEFSLRVIYLPRGTVRVTAVPGVNDEILSDGVPGMGTFRLAALAALARETSNRIG